MKRYTIDFFQVLSRQGSKFASAADVFAAVAQCKKLEMKEDSHLWEIREFSKVGDNFQGTLAKLKFKDLPPKARAGQPEQPLGLDDDEGLLHKNHFKFYADRSLLLWQANKSSGSAGRLRQIFKALIDADISVSAVLQSGAAARLLAGKSAMKSFTVTFARPTNAELYAAADFSSRVLGALNDVGGDKITVTVKTDGRLKHGHPIVDAARQVLADIGERVDVERAVIELELDDDEAGQDEIDLVADRIRVYQNIEGDAPSADAIYGAIDAALASRQQDLDAIFGTNDGSRV